MKDIHRNQFPHDFVWGVACSAFQSEGAASTNGKGPSIWDEFAKQKGLDTEGAGFHNNYRTYLEHLRDLNIEHFRFSISWSRVLPKGTGEVNQAGLQFYSDVIDTCLEFGIQPWVTLYHWDLPQALQEKGGWTNRNIVYWFLDYIQILVNQFTDRVEHWMILNEPLAYTSLGHFLGIHAPKKRGFKQFLPSVHHSLLALSYAAKWMKKHYPNLQVGSTFSMAPIHPYRKTKGDKCKAVLAHAIHNRLFLEPILGLGYPSEIPFLKKMEPWIFPGDLDQIATPLDFLGIQTYTRHVVKRNLLIPYVGAFPVAPKKRGKPQTAMGWEIYPKALTEIAQHVLSYSDVPPFYFTENGVAPCNENQEARTEDKDRIAFLQQHFDELEKLTRKEKRFKGYFLWSMVDNIEWSMGYKPKFGIMAYDRTLKKIHLKKSAHWLADFLRHGKKP